jgi:hypothetical protein
MFEGTIDGASIVAEIEMLRTLRNNAVLVVEGPSDERFFANFADADTCEIVIAWGADNSLCALNIARGRSLTGICYVLDRDYREFLCLTIDDPDVVFTDEHDIEMVMVCSPALTRVFSELGSRQKLREAERKGIDLSEFILDAVYVVGVLRLYAQKHGKALKFDGLAFTFVDHRTFAVDTERLLTDVCNHSRIPKVEVADYHEYLETWRARDHNRWMMCCGHDFAALAGKSLRQMFGTRNAREVTGEEIESRLRLAFSDDAFGRTTLAASIRAWEARNPPYKCLSDSIP